MAVSKLQTGIIPLPVAIERYFEVSLYLLVLTGFGTLASTGGLDLPTVVFVGTALLFRGYLLAERRSLFIPERWTSILTLAYAAFYLADYLFISRGFLNATVHLVLFVMVVRLFSAQRDRDQYFLSIIAFLMVLAAAVLTVNSIFLLAFAVFMLMAVCTFILMEMKRAAASTTIPAQNPSVEHAYRKMAFSIMGATGAIVLLTLLGAAAIFFVLPRMSGGYINAYLPTSDVSTGFSDRVELGRIGEIQQSRSVVMHVRVDGDSIGAFDLKWRGIALNVFDGRTWSNHHERQIVSRLVDGSFLLPNADAKFAPLRASLPERQIHYRVLMEPLGNNVFFLAPTAKSVTGNYRVMATDGEGAVFDLDAERPIGIYVATSNLTTPSAEQLRTAYVGYPLEILQNYLQVPAELDSRIPRLATQITSRADNNYDRAATIEAYLQTHFGYTLELSRTVPRDPLAEFLFVRKQGHCEYFASSMAVMLRSLGIPSRIVNGFHGGEFNDLTSQYVVRASDAHSWVEAYFPGYGWISFDPTPAGSSASATKWSRMMLYMDALQSFWHDWVVNYDLGHQLALTQSTTRSGREMFLAMQRWVRSHYESLLSAVRRSHDTVSDSPSRWGGTGVATIVLLLIAGNARRLWGMLANFRLASHPEKAPQTAATIWYERMTKLTARRGWRKSPMQTPKEFLQCIEDPEMRKRVEQFTRHYERARFADSAEDARKLPGLYEEISTSERR
ncbi:MAG: transglutaminase-like protein [Acidobacteriaceae bacterium]|nr:transglutaminase-like protein [Acidobacteriaceae bacterium]